MWNLKYETNEPIYETETKSEANRTDWQLPKGEGWERVGMRVWDWQTQTGICRMDK